MTGPYVFESLVEDDREAMYNRALQQLEAQVFEQDINLTLNPDNPDLTAKRENILESIQKLKDAKEALLG